ncbi:MAG: CPBP family intramembrane metalloprotease [Planctomycetaceae bacterium]|nr:CPBP family intramembrane metalloprotease [Planctomycetaceae bacterium]
MEIALASMLVMMLASGWVLIAYFENRFAEWDPRDPAQEDQPRLSFPALVLVLLMIGDGLWSLFHRSNSPVQLDVSRMQTVVLNGLLIALLLLGALIITPGISLKNYGLHVGALSKQFLFGVLGFVASLLPVFILLFATSVFRSEETLHPFLKMLNDNPTSDTIFWIGAAVMISAPVVEELVYRVVLQTALTRWLPIPIALPLTAVIFCAMHGWPDMVPLLPLALILGWIYYRHRSYLAVVTTHALFNGWMLAWALVAPNSA